MVGDKVNTNKVLEGKPPIRWMLGDAQAQLRKIPDNVISCTVTSPPYWGQREYESVEESGYLGNEPNPQDYIDKLVAIFREVRRVTVKPHNGGRGGILWLNVCDTIASHRSLERDWIQGESLYGEQHHKTEFSNADYPTEWGIQEKSLACIPFRLATAMIADGWIMRSCVPWVKTSNNPGSSHPARPPGGFEWLMMFAAGTPNFYDEYAAMVPTRNWVGPRLRRDSDWWLDSFNGLIEDMEGSPLGVRVNTAAGKSIHNARFSESLVRPLIETSCPRAVCSKCNAHWKRISESIPVTFKGQPTSIRETLGWMPACKCNAPAKRAVVLDPFGGSGTTNRVAMRLNRASVYIDPSDKYMAEAKESMNGVEVEETLPEKYEGRIPKKGEKGAQAMSRYRNRDLTKEGPKPQSSQVPIPAKETPVFFDATLSETRLPWAEFLAQVYGFQKE
jgi:hypothetical protein